MRIVLGNSSLAQYPQGGGHWAVRLQYLLGLRGLHHDVMLLELLWSTGDTNRDEELIGSFFSRMNHYGFTDNCVLLLFDKGSDEQDLDRAHAYGRSLRDTREIIKSADLLWNDCCGIREPLLGMFRYRALVDLDPGHLQVSALTVDLDLHSHQAFLTVGKKLHDTDCEVPTLGLKWHTFFPFVYLPMWELTPDPGQEAPFSSVTHWEWGELCLQRRVLSISKRDAYLRYLELPKRLRRPFELAANTGDPDDVTGDRQLFARHGWKLVDPWEVAKSPLAYQAYIARSRAEISCAKPVFRELKTGWFSDRSVCYLASGRPVLAEDTGFSDHLSTGRGLLCFNSLEEAVAGVTEIDRNYPQHMRAARELAEEHLSSQKWLSAMLSACGW